ncbi:hypothetical protein ABG067_001299 [Albugo candida]
MLQERFVYREEWPTTRSRGWSSQKDPRSTRLLAEVASDAISTAKEKIITAGGVAKERMHQWYVSFHTRCDLTIPAEDRSLQPLILRPQILNVFLQDVLVLALLLQVLSSIDLTSEPLTRAQLSAELNIVYQHQKSETEPHKTE